MKHIKLYENFSSLNEGASDENLKHLRDLRTRVLKVCPRAKIEVFDSGYVGMSVVLDKKKWYVFDQPGHVGLEDQSGPYISLEGPGRKEIMKYRHDSHRFGDVRMPDSEREKIYKEIVSYFQKEYKNLKRS